MLDKILVNLRILQTVAIGEKIYIGSDQSIHNLAPTYLNRATRLITGNNRQGTLTFVSHLVQLSVDYSNKLMNSKVLLQNQKKTFFDVENEAKERIDLENLSGAMRDSQIGFNNLQITYSDDASFIAQMCVLKEKVVDQNRKIERFFSQFTE